MAHVALYLRLSPRPDGSYEGIGVQDRAGRRYAEQRWPGLPVVVYTDEGLSAASGGPRPGFEALREAIRAGQVARLWAAEQTRLERTEVGWFQFAAELVAAGIEEVHTDRDGVVRVGDEVAGIKAVLAAAEIRRIQRRTKARLADNAAAGQPSPAQPFGYRHATRADGVKTYEPIPERAAAIRDAAGKILAGWALTNVAKHLTAQGIRGGRGAVLSTVTVRSMVTAPAVAGLRVHQGRIVGPGNWPAILDEQTWRAVCAKLATARTVATVDGREKAIPAPGRRSARRYLLSGGLAVCGACGVPLVGTLKHMRGKATPYYICGTKFGGRACVGILAGPAEEFVISEVMRALATPEFVAALATDDYSERRGEIARSLEDLGRQRTELAALWAQGGSLSTAEWEAARSALGEREAALRGEREALPPPAVDIDPAVLTDPRVWEAMTLDERRELVRLFVARVELGRATPPFRPGGDPAGRIAITFH